ncbi:phage holin family protein [Hymenobacter lutimineralis]|uniref:Phage holin family protein n=1 Tax=Hymenobacter lutimineralis TaxID=2606448 RepID=A0A5D6V8F1_9BACT|nr:MULTISPECIES: phage holin family protein [Hymenobacter]QIX61496.1 phage holin family protein [Hymenobacter sp. BT18]TYZ11495.1 phage holin family protein [Hymenobacter lutimineralis]
MAYDDDASKTPRNDSLMGNLMGYLDTRIDLIRLETQEKVKVAFVGTAHGVTMALIGLLFLVFLSIFAGLALNDALDSSFWGFGIVAGFYLLLLIIFIVGVDKKLFQGLADKMLSNTIYKSDKRQA